MSTRVVLKRLESEKGLYNQDGRVVAVFTVGSDNQKSTLDQDLTLTQTEKGWTAEMPMLDFPPQKTSTAAAWKLAEWMERMAQAIKDREFDQINLNGL